MKAKPNEEKAMMECYIRLFDNSEPKGDFKALMESATINKRGQKEIPFMDYEITEEKMDEIISDVIKEFKIKPEYRRKAFRISILLGCSPKTKRTW